MNRLESSLLVINYPPNSVIELVYYVKRTPREVGVNLKNGYNGDLTSREAGSVGGQMVKKMCPVRTMNYERQSRTAVGHCQKVEYIASMTV